MELLAVVGAVFCVLFWAWMALAVYELREIRRVLQRWEIHNLTDFTCALTGQVIKLTESQMDAITNRMKKGAK